MLHSFVQLDACIVGAAMCAGHGGGLLCVACWPIHAMAWLGPFAHTFMFTHQDGAPLGPQHYWGVYLGAEKIDRSKHRVDVKKLTWNDTDLSGVCVYV